MLGSDSHRFQGALGGFQAGYNWQLQNFLIGIETDIQASGQRGSQTFLGTIIFPPQNGSPPTTSTTNYTDKLPWFGTLRGRADLIAADHWLIYASGGLAYGEVELSGVSSIPPSSVGGIASVPPAAFSLDSTRVGWTAGAGVEGAISGNWSWKFEYLYLNFGSVSGASPFVLTGASCTAHPGGCFAVSSVAGTASTRVTDNVVRFGMNYRFH
jgi:outer membrane immunogenic protein